MTKGDVYAQRVDSSGNIHWQTNGLPVCTDTAQQDVPVIISDGLGGAIMAWYDTRGVGGTSTQGKIYAQKIDSDGVNIWPLNGVAVCTADSPRSWPGLVIGKPGNVIISWFDDRNGNWDMYAQCLNTSGTAEWILDGISICSAAGTQFNDIYSRQYQSVYDGSGSAIMVWHDTRNGNYDIYAQKIGGLTGVAGYPTVEVNEETRRLQVYPNPFKGYANIGGIKEGTEIKVYDITGRLVERANKSVIGKKLSAGVYFITAEKYKIIKAIKIK